MERIEKQIKAVMLGHAVGDALGVLSIFLNVRLRYDFSL